MPSAAHPVLEHYYETVISLHDYLSVCLPVELAQTLFDELIDPPTYATLLQRAQVAVSAREGVPRLALEAIEKDISLEHVIRRAQRDLLSVSPRIENVLCLGYTLNHGVLHNRISNSSLTEMQESDAWKLLLARTSPACICHLLKETSLFVHVRADAMRQICGRPLYELSWLGKRALEIDKQTGPPSKRPRGSAGKCANSSEVLLSRQSIFYAHYTKSALKRLVGLAPDNVLITIEEAFPQAHLPAYTEDLAAARHLSKHIWPILYKIDTKEIKRNDMRVRLDAAISAMGPVKTPNSLKAVLPMLRDLLQNYRTANFTAMRRRMVPSTLRRAHLSQEERFELFNSISEDSAPPLTQQIASDGSSLAASSLEPHASLNFVSTNQSTKARKATPKPPRFADFAVKHWKVSKYLQACLRRVVPIELVGSAENMEKVCSTIDTYVKARRYETFSLFSVMQGLKTGACTWGVPEPTRRRTADASQQQRTLLESVILWIFNHFVVDLCTATFYVTESSAFQRQTMYFLQEDWHTICAPLVDNMAKTLFREVSKEEADATLAEASRKLSFSHVRLLPKDKGVRPIVNLSRRPASVNNGAFRPLSINQTLQNAFAILSFEKSRREELVGSAAQAFSNVYRRIKAYKQSLLKLNLSHARLYLVKLDIRACFDSIDQDKLLTILTSIVEESEYTVTKYTTFAYAREAVLRRFVKEAHAADEFTEFPELAFQLADVLRRVVFVDQLRPAVQSRQAVMALLREHVKENIVKIGQRYYRQAVGIPQGSILSTLLCNFFYGYMESQELAFTRDDGSLLIRFVDDFLFVSTDKAAAERFLRKMHKGHPEYGCFVSTDKTLVNFDTILETGEVVKRVEQKEPFPWCGHLVDQKTLEFRYDYGRRVGVHLSNTLTVRTHKRPGEAFLNTMLYSIKMRMGVIFVDTSFAKVRTVYLNAYQALKFVAMKYHSYLKIWKPNLDGNISFFLGVIHRVVHYGFLAMKACFHPKIVAECGATIEGVRKAYIHWLGYHAFISMLSRKPTKYSSLLRQLKYIRAFKTNTSMVKALRPVLAHSSNSQFDRLRF